MNRKLVGAAAALLASAGLTVADTPGSSPYATRSAPIVVGSNDGPQRQSLPAREAAPWETSAPTSRYVSAAQEPETASPSTPAPRSVAQGQTVTTPWGTSATISQYAGGEPVAADASFGTVGGMGERIWVSAEYIFWSLREDRVPPLVTAGSENDDLPGVIGQPGTTVLFEGDIHDEWRSGGRFTLGFFLDDAAGIGLEGSFFFLDTETDSDTFTSDRFPVLAIPFFNVNSSREFGQVGAFPDVSTGSIRVDATSEFWGGEANFVSTLSDDGATYRIRLLGGFRYLSLDEEVAIREEVFAVDPDVVGFDQALVRDRFNTSNDFYGGQFGLGTSFRSGRFSLDLHGKVALGVTEQEVEVRGSQVVTSGGQSTEFTGGVLAQQSNIGRRSEEEFSVVPEAGVNVGFFVTDWARVFAGYSFLYWSDVARPGDQIDRGVDVTQIPNFEADEPSAGGTRPSPRIKTTDLWVHGLNFGVEFRW